MSGDGKNPTGFPGADTDGDLDSEFDKWDEQFDALFDATFDALDGGDSGGGGLLDDAPDSALSGGGERASFETPSSGVPGLSKQPSLRQSDMTPFDEPSFGGGGSEPTIVSEVSDIAGDDDMVFTSSPRPEPVPAADDDEPEEITLVLEVDDDLLARAASDAAAEEAAEGPVDVWQPPASGQRPKPRSTLSPALVRREDLERRRREQMAQAADDEDDDDHAFGGEPTRVADLRQIESLVETAEAHEDEPEEVVVAVDDEFYDDIEIGESGARSQPAAAPEPARRRRVTTNVVRRDPSGALPRSRAPSGMFVEVRPEPSPAADDAEFDLDSATALAAGGAQPASEPADDYAEMEFELDAAFGDAEDDDAPVIEIIAGPGAGQGAGQAAGPGGEAGAATGVDEAGAATGVDEVDLGAAGAAGDAAAAGTDEDELEFEFEDPFADLEAAVSTAPVEAEVVAEPFAAEPAEPEEVAESFAAEPVEPDQPEAIDEIDELFLDGLGSFSLDSDALAPSEPVPTAQPAKPALEDAETAQLPSRDIQSAVIAHAAAAAADDELAETTQLSRGAAPDELAETTQLSRGAAPDELAETTQRPRGAAPDETATTQVARGRVPALELSPELPPARFTASEPALDLGALVIPDAVEPDLSDRSEMLAGELALYERELLEQDESPAAARIRLEAGRLAELLGDDERARLHYEEALLFDAQSIAALRGLGRIERAAGNWSEVLSHLDAELELATGSERAALAAHRADLLVATGDQDLARVQVGEILDDHPTDTRALLSNLELAYIDGRDDEFVRTLSALAEVIEDRTLSASFHVVRGRFTESRAAEGDVSAYRTAAEAYRTAWDIDPDAVSAALGAARTARRAGDRSAAAAVIGALASSRAADADPAYAAALSWRRALWARAAGDRVQVLDALRDAARLAPNEPIYLDALASAARTADDHAGAADALRRLGDASPAPAERAMAYVRAADTLRELGDADGAVAALRLAAEVDPSNPTAAVMLEAALVEAGDTDGLIALERRAAEADPAGAIYERVRAAQRLIALDQLDAAAALLEAGREAAPASPALSDTLAEVLALAGRWGDRVTLLSELAESGGEHLDPDAAQTRAARAAEYHAYQLAHTAAFARAHADQLAGQPDADAALAHAESLEQERDRALTRALDAWNRALDVDPDSAVAHAACIRLAATLGDADVMEDVLARAQAAARGGPGNGHDRSRAVTMALERVALLLHRDDPDLGRVEDILREMLAAAPGDPRPAVRMLVLAAGGGRWGDAALALEERATALGDGDEALALRYRAASLLLHHADEPAQAASLLAEVARARPAFAPALDLLEVAHRRMGDPGGVSEFRTEIAGTGADSFARLVREAELCHHGMGDPGRAVELFLKALAIRADDPLARDGLDRAAAAANAPAPLADLALADLKRAEERGDAAAKADAYEELARIDRELRGDPGSALLALQSASTADPSRGDVLRMLERAYVREQRWLELFALYEQQFALICAPDATPEQTLAAAPLVLERARLAEKLERSGDDVLAEYRRARVLDPSNRMSLFRLEAASRQRGPSPEQAALEQAVADYFEGDARARAAFLTRAGETLAELDGHPGDLSGSADERADDGGRLDAAIAQFRAANEAAGGDYAPALFGWRNAAIRGGLWLDVAEACQREARVTRSRDTQIALHHLAGVALMDKALAGERAMDALRQVLALDPGHHDAFVRLRVLLEEQGEHDALAELLENRLAVEVEPGVQVWLHRELAGLSRNFLDDRDGARRHLRAVLEFAPNDIEAISQLSDIAWEQGDWQDAADMLIARAKIERDRAMLKNIFYRLGTIYSEFLPDPRWAISSFKKVLSYDDSDEGALDRLSVLGMQTGDWQLALGACERLVKLAHDDELKVRYLHRAGEIYDKGFGDRARAQRAYRAALDLAPTSDEARERLIAFFADSGDIRSVRVYLDQVAASMRARLAADPTDAEPYRVLARALAARERAGAVGSLAAARCAAELALLHGVGDDSETDLVDSAEPPKRLAALGGSDLDEQLFPAEVSNAVRQMFGLLGDRIAKHVGSDLRRYEVSRSDRVRKREDPVLVLATEVAQQMGIDQVAVYVSQKQPTALAAEPTNPISLVLGADIARGDRPAQLRFAVARALKLALSQFAVPARMRVDDFGALLVGLLRLFVPDFSPVGLDQDAVGQQRQRLDRLIPNSARQELRPFAIGITGAQFDPKQIWAGLQRAGDRAGLLASGSVRASLSVLCALRGYADLTEAADDLDVRTLIAFALSEDYVQLRARLDEPPPDAQDG